MARGDPLFAKFDCAFVRDPRWLALTPTERAAYVSIWCLAVELRKETLSTQASTPRYLSHVAQVNHRAVASLIQKGIDFPEPLFKKNGDGQLTVCGVMSKHPRLFPTQDPGGEDTGPTRDEKSPQEEEGEEREKERIDKRKRKREGESEKERDYKVRPLPRDDFFSSLLETFRSQFGREPTSRDEAGLRNLLGKYGHDKAIWNDAFAACRRENKLQMDFLGGCLRHAYEQKDDEL